jgi:prephenate dehydratase
MSKLFYLGPEGSFSHILAKQILPSIEPSLRLESCESFSEIAKLVDLDPSSCGLLVVENSITSDVHEAVDLFFARKLWIDAEAQLRISMNLIGLEGSSLDQIHAVSSKLPAIAQCSEFIKERGLKVKYAESTSLALQEIMHSGDIKTAAIGARALTESYAGTKVLASNIGNQQNNLTRFVLVRKREGKQAWGPDSKKLTVIVELPHAKGSLANYLLKLAEIGANLTRIESRPVPGTEWEYQFWIDLEASSENIVSTIDQARRYSTRFELLGVYPKGKVYLS